MLKTFKEWDENLLIYLNNLGTDSYDSFWVFSTQIESWTALFLFFSLLIFYYLKKKKGLLVYGSALLMLFLTLLLTDTTKALVERLRPNNTPEIVNLIRVLQYPETYSFFSGHASTSFAITTFLVLAIRPFNRWIYLAYLWPLVFVSSRIYVGVHYPSDILIGALVGTLMAISIWALLQRVIPRV
ncbi:MAG: phosphatase PAP2 family protein [Bacteroidetes bacterium]|nr:phosphatase PAP2 family protein [Bacteroidota bacterium]